MEALRLEGPHQLVRRHLAVPHPEPGQVLVDVAITGIGGSEYLGYANPGIRPLPSIMGHGFCGTTADGQRVAVNPLRGCNQCHWCSQGLQQLCPDWQLIGVQLPGGFAQQVAVPKDSLVALPDALSWEQSCFIEPIANAVNAWDRSGANRSSRVAVIGAGGLGLGVVCQAAAIGCQQIEVCDPSLSRREAAEQLGAHHSQPALQGHFDVVFDTVGSEASRTQALNHCRPNGRVVLLGFACPTSSLNLANLIRSQQQLIGAFVYAPAQFQRAITLASACNPGWVDHLDFDGVSTQLNRYLDGDFTVIRSALRPND